MKDLKTKVLLLIISGVLLVAVIIYMTFAWYTKMTSIKKTEFEVAKWDFSANFAQDDFEINVYDYQTVTHDHAAPGTQGYIQMRLSTAASNTDVDYVISVDKTTMSTEFQERIYFYYLDSHGAKKEMKSKDDRMYGTIEKGEEKTVTIYWEWIYSYSEMLTKLGMTQAQVDVADPTALPKERSEEKFDEFDTEVGKNPELYKSKMRALISITGAETVPD